MNLCKYISKLFNHVRIWFSFSEKGIKSKPKLQIHQQNFIQCFIYYGWSEGECMRQHYKSVNEGMILFSEVQIQTVL
jgi:hypothetical protein